MSRRSRARAFQTSSVLYSLKFPSNTTGTANNLPYSVIEFDDPYTNGLPVWGPSGAGVTVIRRIKVVQQPGYYAQFWWSESDGSFNTDGAYWGFHPYPPGGGTGTSHVWEIATGANDYLPTRGGGNLTVVKDQWFVQALRITRNSADSKTLVFYCDLPSTNNANVIETTVGFTNYGEGAPSFAHKLTIGDSPWFSTFQNERASSYLSHIKIFDKVLSEADMLSEAANMNALVTAEGQTNIWWGKKGFAGIDALACDFGTGRSFVRNDASNLITLGSIV